jgi:hypothetical protein
MTRDCSIESEIGRVPLLLNGGGALALKPKERLWSFSFVELLLEYCKDLSYRSAAHKLNLALRRSQGQELIPRTLADFTRHCGDGISTEMKNIADRVLRQFGFDPSTRLPVEEASLPVQIVKPSCAGEDDASGHECRLSGQIAAINAQREEEAQITRLELARQIEPSEKNCCYISIDDIGVKHQKDKREDGFVKERKYVENTVVHVQADGRSHCLTAVGMDQAFSILLAFLLANKLMENRRLVFFTDGAADIKTRIESVFAFRPYAIVLDWYHLKKKCKELISSSFKGGKSDKQDITQRLLRMLWAGNTDSAASYLGGIDAKMVKSERWRDELVSYIQRKEPNIACYALRHSLGLRVSSNRVEKANDLVVAQRQKHNGMSWSFAGSGALAAITMVFMNNEVSSWVRTRALSFAMPENPGFAA